MIPHNKANIARTFIIESSFAAISFYKDEVDHRDLDLPSIICYDIWYKAFCFIYKKNGILHRPGLPAHIAPGHYEAYWEYGSFISETFQTRIN
jgi:hypothetical protein